MKSICPGEVCGMCNREIVYGSTGNIIHKDDRTPLCASNDIQGDSPANRPVSGEGE